MKLRGNALCDQCGQGPTVLAVMDEMGSEPGFCQDCMIKGLSGVSGILDLEDHLKQQGVDFRDVGK